MIEGPNIWCVSIKSNSTMNMRMIRNMSPVEVNFTEVLRDARENN